MIDPQAAIGIHQLERVERSWLPRKEIWARPQQAFQALPIGTPAEPAQNTRHAYHLYTITIQQDDCGLSRDESIDKMGRANIGVWVHYLSLAQHPYYKKRFGWTSSDFPVVNEFGLTTVTLPLSPKLTDDDISRIIEAVRKTVFRQDLSG